MNNCILMAEIVENPQLRYTSDNLEISGNARALSRNAPR